MSAELGAYGSAFASFYDRITAHKDYEAEAVALDALIRAEVGDPAPRVLDVGCGTGTHAALLVERGYDVTAVEPSPEMAGRAAEKLPPGAVVHGEIEDVDADGFQFCCSLFNVVNCLDSLEALLGFLSSIGARMADGGVLLVEAWNAVAVIAEPPERVERTYDAPGGTIRRTVVPRPDFLRQRLELDYRLESPDGSATVTHGLTLFTPLEMEHALGAAGFRDVRVLTALPELRPASTDDRMLAFACVRSG